MTQTEFLDIQKTIETKIKHGTLIYAGLSFIIVALSSFALLNGLVTEEYKLLTIGGVFAVIVVSQILAFKRIRHLNKSISLSCYSCNLHLSAEKLAKVIDNGLCTSCGKSAFSVQNT
jgi:hypothetical protein